MVLVSCKTRYKWWKFCSLFWLCSFWVLRSPAISPWILTCVINTYPIVKEGGGAPMMSDKLGNLLPLLSHTNRERFIKICHEKAIKWLVFKGKMRHSTICLITILAKERCSVWLMLAGVWFEVLPSLAGDGLSPVRGCKQHHLPCYHCCTWQGTDASLRWSKHHRSITHIKLSKYCTLVTTWGWKWTLSHILNTQMPLYRHFTIMLPHCFPYLSCLNVSASS